MRRLARPGPGLLLAVALLVAPAGAEPLGVGDAFPALVLEDQHGETHHLGEAVRLVLFARDMGAGDVVKAALAEGGAELLAGARAVYIADVHGMPALVRRLFALPALRRRPYPVLLDLDGEATRDLPAREGEVTLLVLEGMRVMVVGFQRDSEALRAGLETRSRSGR